MEKKLLIGIIAFLLSLSAIGQSPAYYLAELTIVRYILDPNDEESQSSKYKFHYKYGADEFVRYYASYYWDEQIESENERNRDRWLGKSKNEFVDSNNNLQVFYTWDLNTNDWSAVKKIERKYNSNKQEIFNVVWEKENEQWMPHSKTEDEKMNNKVTHSEFKWSDNNNEWVPCYKHEDEYNIKGERILWSSFYWEVTKGYWEARSKTEFIYNDNRQLVQQINFITKDSVLGLHSKMVNAKYSKTGQVDLSILYNWNERKHSWVEESRYRATKEKGKNKPNENKHWDNKLNTWVDNVKTESQYDALGREILAVSYQWDSKGKIWNSVSKKEIEFDDKNNPIITRYYSFYLEKWVLSEALECRFEKR